MTLTDRIGTTNKSRPNGRRIPYSDVPCKLRNRAPFAANSMSAQIETDGAYVVYSYATVIATVDASDVVTIIDRNHWGVTTGRHINLCRANLR